MTCREFRALCESYVRGSIGTRDASAVEAHAVACEQCEAYLLGLADLGQSVESCLGSLSPPPHPRALRRVQAALPRQPHGMPDACYLLRPSLSALLDNSLDPSDEDCVRAHLASCSACTAELRDMSFLEDVARSDRAVPSRRFERRLRKLVGRYTAQPAPRWRRLVSAPALGGLAAVAAAAAVFVVGVRVGRLETPPAVTPLVVQAAQPQPEAAPIEVAELPEPILDESPAPVAASFVGTAGTSRYVAASSSRARAYRVAPSPAARPRVSQAARHADDPGVATSGGVSESSGARSQVASPSEYLLNLDMRGFASSVPMNARPKAPAAPSAGSAGQPASPSPNGSAGPPRRMANEIEAEIVRVDMGAGDDFREPSGPARLY